MELPKLVDHLIYRDTLPPLRAPMYDYVLAANGVYIRAKRTGLYAQFPVTIGAIHDLQALEDKIVFEYPRVPERIVAEMLERSRRVVFPNVEVLFHLVYEAEAWTLYEPPQVRNGWSVRPAEDGPGSSYARAIIEVHSHFSERAFWSPGDNQEEQGFRIYAVLGNVQAKPELVTRVGVYGHHWIIPAAIVFELPPVLHDACDNA
jgi:PRTRC genetic system protein A